MTMTWDSMQFIRRLGSLFHKYWQTTRTYLWDSRHAFRFVTLLFVLHIGIGALFADSIFALLGDRLTAIMQTVQTLNTVELIGFLFVNNLRAAVIGLVTGVVFGIIPVFVAMTNGLIIGAVATRSVSVGGIMSLWRLLPHGIFELPALLIALTLGVRLGTAFFTSHRWQIFKFRFRHSILALVMVVVPLLLIAALIEGILIGLQ